MTTTLGEHNYVRYRNSDCRCDECRRAHRDRAREERAAREARGLDPGDPRHGSSNGYNNYGCRCELCSVAQSWDQAISRRRRREAQR